MLPDKFLYIGWYKTATTTMSKRLYWGNESIYSLSEDLREYHDRILSSIKESTDFSKAIMKELEQIVFLSPLLIDERITQWRGYHSRTSVNLSENEKFQDIWADILESRFSDYQIILSYRNISSWIKSLYKQDLKSGALHSQKTLNGWIKSNYQFLCSATNVERSAKSFWKVRGEPILLLNFDDEESRYATISMLKRRCDLTEPLGPTYEETLNESFSDGHSSMVLTINQFLFELEKTDKQNSKLFEKFRERIYHANYDSVQVPRSCESQMALTFDSVSLSLVNALQKRLDDFISDKALARYATQMNESWFSQWDTL